MKSLESLTTGCINLLHKNNLLKSLIRSELIKTIHSKIIVEEDVKKNLMSQFMQKIDITDKIKHDEWLENNNLNKNDLENLVLANIRSKEYCKNNFDHQVEARFLERKNELDIVVYSLIRVKEFFLARELYLRLIEKEAEFGDLASNYSEGIENKTRGIIGPAPIGRAHPRIMEILKKLKAGEVHAPILIDNFYLIARLEYYQSARLDDFMREKMREELFNDWLEKECNIINDNILERSSVKNNIMKPS